MLKERLEALFKGPVKISNNIKPVEGEDGGLIKVEIEVNGELKTLRKSTGVESENLGGVEQELPPDDKS